MWRNETLSWVLLQHPQTGNTRRQDRLCDRLLGPHQPFLSKLASIELNLNNPTEFCDAASSFLAPCLCPGNIHLSILRSLVHCTHCSKLISFHSQGNSKYPVLWEDWCCRAVHVRFPTLMFHAVVDTPLTMIAVSVAETTNLCLLVLPKIRIHCCPCLSLDLVSAL